MDLYRGTFAGAILLNAIFFYRSYRAKIARVGEENAEKVEHRGRDDDDERLSVFKRRFFVVYLLVNGADWLQGPYIYPIYKDDKGLPEEVVAFLFMIGFLAAGISASFTGAFADRYGRRLACLSYCVIYSLSCLTLLSDYLPILFVGRVLGGMSGTLLYSVFESWMVAEFNGLMLAEAEATLSGIFSTMTMLNSLVAIIAGVAAEGIVQRTGSAKGPFMASIVCLGFAFVAILHYWGENFGGNKGHDGTSEAEGLLEQQTNVESEPKPSAFKQVIRDAKILALGLTSCFFEGSLFLFIFFKFPALTLSHKLGGSTGELPFGLIFAIFMCSMMFGSMLHNHLTASNSPVPVTRLLVGTLVVAAVCFLVPTFVRDESITLWSFCLFEVCCGVYYPVMAHLKGKLIDDASRASIYGFLRVPLNIFVVLALSTTREGEHHRNLVFMTCSGLLLSAALVVHRAVGAAGAAGTVG